MQPGRAAATAQTKHANFCQQHPNACLELEKGGGLTLAGSGTDRETVAVTMEC